MDKKEALRIILKSAKEYDKNLSNNNIMFVYRNKRQQLFSFEVTFLPRNFLHLTGIKITNKEINSSIKFYRACISNKLSVKDFKYSEDGKTVMKINVLPQIVKSHKVVKMFGEYNHTKPYLFTEKITGNIKACIGFIKDKDYYVPNTALQEDIRDMIDDETKGAVMYIFKKKVGDMLYSNITYVADGYRIDKLFKSNEIINKIDKPNLNIDLDSKNEKLNKFVDEFKKYELKENI